MQEKGENQASGDDLELINNWLKQRFSAGTSDPRKADTTARHDVSKLKDSFLKQKLHELCKTIGIKKPEVMTVRSSFRMYSLYLRPIFSKPDALGQLFLNPVFQQPFEFEVRRQKSPFEGLLCIHPELPKRAPSTFCAVHQLDTENNRKNISPSNSFPLRINAFWKLLSESGKHELSSITSKKRTSPVFCLFAGRNKPNLNKHELKLKHIMAIYFSPKKEADVSQICTRFENENTQRICDSLFNGIDLIAAIDAALFKSEGLELVAAMSPQFAREDIAPADKIAFAIEKLRKLLSLHMIGRHGGDKKPSIFYQAATFERNSKHELMPRLEMYPHVYRDKYPYGSFLVAHHAVPSATKFLLMQYMLSNKHEIVEVDSDSEKLGNVKRQPVKLSKDFVNLFTKDRLGTHTVQDWADIICPPEQPDVLDMVAHDERLQDITKDGQRTPWEALNRNLNPDSSNASITAFVVDGKRVSDSNKSVPNMRCLPCGIFVIESEYIDAFSDTDIRSLRDVFSGVASLIRQISHQHAPIEYRSRITEAFERLLLPEFEGWTENALKLLFLVQKLDGKQLEKLLNEIENARKHGREDPYVTKAYDLTPADFNVVKNIAKLIQSTPDELSGEEARTKIELRVENLRSILESKDADKYNSQHAIKFLEACTENLTWVGYLNSMPQCMGDRINKKLPQFRAMSPGYSAADVFMARVEGELRQVIKLDSAKSLRAEMRNYKKYVRFKLVNAARISSNAFAFDTRGEDGLKSADKMTIECKVGYDGSFGVLVSDLVSGGGNDPEEVRTFLDVIAHAIGNPESQEWPTFNRISEAIETIFKQNDKLWSLDENKLPINIGVLNSVNAVLRLPANKRDRESLQVEQRREERLRCALSSFSLISGCKFVTATLRQLRKNFNNCMINRDDLRQILSIVHGDLNSRNLTWADALSSFFLIDFEHVGPGIKGVDQFRLVVNTLTELFGTWVWLRCQDDYTKIWNALDKGTTFLISLFGKLMQPGEAALHEVINEMTEDKSSDHPSHDIVRVFGHILRTASELANGTNQRRPQWRCFWAYVLFCAVLKECEYSCRRVRKEVVETLTKDVDICSEELSTIYTALREKLQEQNTKTEDEGYYLRHFIAVRLLKSICERLRK